MSARRTVSLLTLGCARNEVDSEELAARLEASGWELTEEPGDAGVVVVNTCGFIEAAKQESIDLLLEAGERGAKVVAAGCMAERYGAELAAALPEADAVLGFDHYADIGDRLDDVVSGRQVTAHEPRDRRTLLPITPVERGAAAVHTPGHGDAPGRPGTGARSEAAAGEATAEAPGKAPGEAPDLPEGLAPASGPRVLRRRLGGGPSAPLKIASGCDRRCTFCAIPAFRGAYVSRSPDDIVAEAEWLAARGVRELFLVSENSTSYGKDLGDLRLLEGLLPRLAAVPGVAWVRVSYLQPAEVRPGLIDVMTSTPGVLPYFDLSFQHASGPVLRRMRRFGDRERFSALVRQIRERAPEAGIRSNFIVGFPGETEDDVVELERFLTEARLDAVGVFGYSDEDGTEAANLEGKLPEEVVAERVARIGALAEELMAQRAEDRVGDVTEVLIEESLPGEPGDPACWTGRAVHQAPEVDGAVTVLGDGLTPGDIVPVRLTGSFGVDLEGDAVLDGDAALEGDAAPEGDTALEGDAVLERGRV